MQAAGRREGGPEGSRDTLSISPWAQRIEFQQGHAGAIRLRPRPNAIVIARAVDSITTSTIGRPPCRLSRSSLGHCPAASYRTRPAPPLPHWLEGGTAVFFFRPPPSTQILPAAFLPRNPGSPSLPAAAPLTTTDSHNGADRRAGVRPAVSLTGSCRHILCPQLTCRRRRGRQRRRFQPRRPVPRCPGHCDLKSWFRPLR